MGSFLLRSIALLGFLALTNLSVGAVVLASEKKPEALEGVSIDPPLGEKIPLDELFLNEEGKEVRLGDYFTGSKPVVLILNYYGCPMLCGLLLNGARDSFLALDRWLPGQQYKVVTISFDPKEGSDLAAAKKASVLGSIEREDFRKAAQDHWHFLVGKAGSEARLAAALGFRYRWVEESKEWAHGAALFVGGADGRLLRVLGGIQFSPRDLKLSLLEAGQGKVGTFAEKLVLFCYHYDPKGNKYALFASRLVSLAGALTVVLMAIAYFVLYLRSRRTEPT
jgi:protein SCO1